jgi:hypothetical protein
MNLMTDDTQGGDAEEGTRVIPPDTLDFEAVIARSQAACDVLSDDDDGLKREVLAHAGNRWSLGTSMLSAWPVRCGMPNWRAGWKASRSVC